MRRDLGKEVGDVIAAEELCQQKLRLFALIGGVNDPLMLKQAEDLLMNAKAEKTTESEKADDFRQTKVGEAGFSHQLAAIIRGKGFDTLGELADKTEGELSEAGFKKSLPKIEEVLRQHGLR